MRLGENRLFLTNYHVARNIDAETKFDGAFVFKGRLTSETKDREKTISLVANHCFAWLDVCFLNPDKKAFPGPEVVESEIADAMAGEAVFMPTRIEIGTGLERAGIRVGKVESVDVVNSGLFLPAAHGDSGSPVFNLAGKIVGIIWGVIHRGIRLDESIIALLNPLVHHLAVEHSSMINASVLKKLAPCFKIYPEDDSSCIQAQIDILLELVEATLKMPDAKSMNDMHRTICIFQRDFDAHVGVLPHLSRYDEYLEVMNIGEALYPGRQYHDQKMQNLKDLKLRKVAVLFALANLASTDIRQPLSQLKYDLKVMLSRRGDPEDPGFTEFFDRWFAASSLSIDKGCRATGL